ncbi:hypothetical protein A2U01_0087950, partial [Trifolium medium]|nr:hypothetical protein [Trifolium medium]
MAELRAAQASLAKLNGEKKSADDRVAELEAAMTPVDQNT